MNPNYNISQEELEAIERYINNTMTIEETAAFEDKLKTNPAFKLEFEDIKTVLLGIETQALKEKMEEFHEAIPKTITPAKDTSKLRHLNVRKLVVAAALIIAVGSYWFVNEDSNSKLFNKYFTPDPGLATTMSSNSNFEFYDAMVNYKQGDYNTAIDKWNLLLETQSKNDTLHYFLGVAYLANKNENKAISFLNTVTLDTNSHFKNEAYYYLGLAYLKANNKELAKKNLTFSTLNKSKSLLSELNN